MYLWGELCRLCVDFIKKLTDVRRCKEKLQKYIWDGIKLGDLYVLLDRRTRCICERELSRLRMNFKEKARMYTLKLRNTFWMGSNLEIYYHDQLKLWDVYVKVT